MMTKNKDTIYTYLIFISIFLVFLDAYQFYSIPLSWIGLSLLVPVSLYEINNTKWSQYSKIIYLLIFTFVIPDIFYIFTNELTLSDYLYIGLRYYNIFSFILVLFFCNYFFTESNLDNFFRILKKYLFSYSVITIYIFFAQIYDLYEPYRNRQNTNFFRDSMQSIFWLSEPHRAMGTFREPLLLITFFLPLVLIYFYKNRKNSILLSLLVGTALGLSRSDYVRVFFVIILLFFIVDYLIKKEIMLSTLTLLFSILIFSTFGVLECNLNPDSIECLEYEEDVQKINNSGNIKIKRNTSNPVTDLDSDRLNVIDYFIKSIINVRPTGIGSVSNDYQDYSSMEISEEMYLTNRTLPRYLLTRYSTQNFGTGNYSLLKYEPNVQNIIVFYTQGFGFIFPSLVYLYFLNLLITRKITLDLIFFLIIVLLIILSPIEELNSYYALLLGLSYNLLITKKDSNEKV